MSHTVGNPPKLLNLYKNEQDRHRVYITKFRVNKCYNGCQNECCLNLHSNQSPRRVPVMMPDGVWNYIPKLCKNSESCKMGERCRFAHSKSECSYHPLVYKVSDCKFTSVEIGKCCKWGFDCSFAHEAPDRRTKGLQKGTFDPVTYKTIRCPDKLCKGLSCVFFHNSKERRRSQLDHYYTLTPCKFVFKDRSFLNPDQCPNKDSCDLAHTKNEVYFHKELYLSKPCLSAPCYAPYCAFIHREDNSVQEENSIKGENSIKEEDSVREEVKISSVEETKKEKEGVSQELKGKPQGSAGKEQENKIPLKLRCKNCGEREIKWVLECGVLVCGKCIGSRCLKCDKLHATRIDL